MNNQSFGLRATWRRGLTPRVRTLLAAVALAAIPIDLACQVLRHRDETRALDGLRALGPSLVVEGPYTAFL